MLEKKDLSPDFRFNILLKLGYISYELGDYQGALNYFDQIAGTYKNYDRVLIGYAWASYKIELDKPLSDQRDLSFTVKNLEIILEVFFGSDYYLEAKTLLGYVNQLQEKVNEALYNYEYAYRARDIKKLSDDMDTERDKLRTVISDVNKLEKKSLRSNNQVAYTKAKSMKVRLKQPYKELTYSDLSASGVAAKNEVMRLKRQLDELDRLKKIAKERGEEATVDRIETVELKIYRAVNNAPVLTKSTLGRNYFDEHPFARKESVIESENKKVKTMRDDARKQVLNIVQKIAQLDMEIQNARSRRDYKKMIQLELARDRFVDIKRKMDFVETQSYSFDIRESYVNLNRWSDYGAFGMANVNFAIRQMKAKQISYMHEQIGAINDFLEKRKQNISYQVKQIEDEITLMTRQVRKQERMREREEMERQFNESYFDTHDTELEYNPDTTDLPKIDETIQQEEEEF